MVAARRIWAGLQLLDRQLVDRDGRLCGMVDDVELSRTESGELYVSAILSGPGALAARLHARRLGDWLRRVNAFVAGRGVDPDRIPFQRVMDIGAHLSLAIDADETGTAATERWVRDHVIDHIPGSERAAE